MRTPFGTRRNSYICGITTGSKATLWTANTRRASSIISPGDCDTDDTTYWNRWITTDTWPVPGMGYEDYYFHTDMSIKPYPPDDSAEFTYTYDPDDPSPTIGGREFIGLGSAGYGPKNQAPIVETREDVLIFSTPPLEEPLKLVGKIKCRLYASSDRIDTDFAVRITDVYPDGRSILMTDGILKARHRIGFDREDFLVPGNVYEFDVDCWSVGHVFNEGHQIRAIISSSNYPRFEVNPNTGAPLMRNDPVRLVANNTIHISPINACRLELPVVPLTPLNLAGSDDAPPIGKPESFAIFAYPNPFNSTVTITIDGVGPHGRAPMQVEIFDVSGRLVERIPLAPLNKVGVEPRETGGSFIWQPDPDLPSGVYLVRARWDSRSLSGVEATEGGRGDLDPTGTVAAKRLVYLK
ncbi:MAG TPA: CocE/NonD family hydrolase [candidate division Zixibacteria bacterium]|nr:CocE/NonD family hydrolase [candidate division Zixibacteria bacterium]